MIRDMSLVYWQPKLKQGVRSGSLEFAAHGRRLAEGVHHRLRGEGVVDICARPKVHNPEGSSALAERGMLGRRTLIQSACRGCVLLQAGRNLFSRQLKALCTPPEPLYAITNMAMCCT